MAKCKSTCDECGQENVFKVYDDGEDIIFFKRFINDKGYKFMELTVRDGNYNFEFVSIPYVDFDDFVKKIILVQGFVKADRAIVEIKIEDKV